MEKENTHRDDPLVRNRVGQSIVGAERVRQFERRNENVSDTLHLQNVRLFLIR